MNLDRRKSLSFSSKTTIAFSVALCSLVRGLKVFTLVKSEIVEMNNILENNNMVFLKCYKIILFLSFDKSYIIYVSKILKIDILEK